MTKQIIDNHFTENIKYYRKVIRDKYYKNYLAEDLLQETYIEFVKIHERIRSHETPALKCLGKKIIASLFQVRNQRKQYEGKSQTSPLYESKTLHFFDIPTEAETEYRDKTAELRIISHIVHKGLAEEDFNTSVHVMAQVESINAMSKRTGINRGKLTDANKTILKQLKHEIINAYESGIITAHTG